MLSRADPVFEPELLENMPSPLSPHSRTPIMELLQEIFPTPGATAIASTDPSVKPQEGPLPASLAPTEVVDLSPLASGMEGPEEVVQQQPKPPASTATHAGPEGATIEQVVQEATVAVTQLVHQDMQTEAAAPADSQISLQRVPLSPSYRLRPDGVLIPLQQEESEARSLEVVRNATRAVRTGITEALAPFVEKVDKLLEALADKEKRQKTRDDDLHRLVRCLERSQKDVPTPKKEKREDHVHKKRRRED